MRLNSGRRAAWAHKRQLGYASEGLLGHNALQETDGFMMEREIGYGGRVRTYQRALTLSNLRKKPMINILNTQQLQQARRE